jgi:uroporphyrinogen-III synthase
LVKQPWGVIEAYPPRERYEWEKIKNLRKQRWISKLPPIATCDEGVYRKLKNFGQVQYFSRGIEDFALHLPDTLIPTRRVLVLRYKNKYDTLVQSLVLRNINVTSAYPVTWAKKEWSPQEDRLAREVDVVYFHEIHGLQEWRARLGNAVRDREVVVACHNLEVAKVAKASGFRDVFYAKLPDTDGLTKTVLEAVEHAKLLQSNALAKK